MPLRFAILLMLVLGGFAAPRITAKTTSPEANHTKLGLVLLSPEFYIEANFPDLSAFTTGTKPILDLCERTLAGQKRPPRLLVQVVLHPVGKPDFAVAGDPQLRSQLAAQLRAELEALTLPAPPLCDVALRFQSLAEGEEPFSAAVAYSPKVNLPENTAVDAFIAADFRKQLALLQDWARHEALPLLTSQAARVDPKFVGVMNTGRALQQRDLTQPLDVEQLTFHNPDFWRGVMEMTPGNQLVGALPVLLFVANGEIDKAASLLGAMRGCTLDKSSGGILFDRLAARLQPFKNHLAERVEKGIALHDRGRHDDAIKCYEAILADYPRSASARYEVCFSKAAKGSLLTGGAQEALGELWGAASTEIYACDPFYSTQMTGSRGKDFGSMIDRLTLRSMAEKPAENPLRSLATYAEVALHLERYGEAALIYWQLLHRKGTVEVQLINDKEPKSLTTEQVITRYLYCLEKLGVPEWKSQFKGDFTTEFAQFDTALEAHRRQ